MEESLEIIKKIIKDELEKCDKENKLPNRQLLNTIEKISRIELKRSRKLEEWKNIFYEFAKSENEKIRIKKEIVIVVFVLSILINTTTILMNLWF